MVLFRKLLCLSENVLGRAKWSFKLNSDIAKGGTSSFSSIAKADIPSPPKRPPTAYMIFCKQHRQNVVKDNPGIYGPELVKALAEKWAKLDPPMKRPYEETARQNTIVYGKLHKEFYENLTEDQRDALHKLKVEMKDKKRLKQLKRALKKSGKPKLPTNAYIIFVQTKSKVVGNIESGTNFIKEVAEQWKMLPEEEKKVFYDKAKDEKLKYENEILKWKKKLTESGDIAILKSYEEHKLRHRTSTSAADRDTSTKKKAAKKSPSNKELSAAN